MSFLSWTRAKARALIGVASAGGLTALATGVYLVGGSAHASGVAATIPTQMPSQAQVDRIAQVLAATARPSAPATVQGSNADAPGPVPTRTVPPAPSSLAQAAPQAASAGDLECLAAAVYYESRGEPVQGQAAVAQVVLNRMGQRHFPNTVCGVVYQGQGGGHGCQFSFACNGAMNRPREWGAWLRAKEVAARALAGYVMADIGAATSFHATHGGATGGVRVGGHVFFAGEEGHARARPLILAQSNPVPSPPRYTFSLGLLTTVSDQRRPTPAPRAPARTPTPIDSAPDPAAPLPKASASAS